MTPLYVALSLQTTSAHDDADGIVEVAAVKFTPEGIIASFSTLVNPDRDLSYRVRVRTGINQSDLRDAPALAEIVADLDRFLADTILLSQDWERDLNLLQAAGVTPRVHPLDISELARLVLPGLPDYTLWSIAKHLNVGLPPAYRAGPNAELVRRTFLAVRQVVASLPPSVLNEMLRLAVISNSSLQPLFQELCERRPPHDRDQGLTVAAFLGHTTETKPRLTPAATTTKLAVLGEEVEAILARALTQPDRFPGFEHRPEQIAMAHAVARTLSEGGQIIVEAGTGTGKSLAYLTPAALYALRNHTHVVISTNTISLQEQLTDKDIPLLQALLESAPESAGAAELRAVTLKGRRNYLCLRRWANLLRSSELSAIEARFLARLLAWVPQTETGDRAELNLDSTEELLWDRVSAGHESCFETVCPFVRDGSCFLVRARKRAEGAHLVIVNHALLLSDIAARGHVLPGYDDLVIDEAHNLEDEATQQFGFSASENEVNEFLNRVHTPGRGLDSGLATSLRNAARGLAAFTPPAAQAASLAAALAERVERVRSQVSPLFRLLEAFMRRNAQENGEYDRRLLLTAGLRGQQEWSEVEEAWENLQLGLAELQRQLEHVQVFLQDCGDAGLLEYDDLVAETGDLLLTGYALATGIDAIISRNDPNRIAWLSAHRTAGTVTLASAPLDVSDLLREKLWERKDSVILTSATLSTEGRFAYIRARLGLDDADELLLGSPFDYARSTLLLLPRDMPDPNHARYQQAVAQAVIDLCQASEGRALVLLTSYGALRALYQTVKRPLEDEGLRVLAQGIDGTPKRLLQMLRDDPRTVLLGTASFWEGVDVIGEALSLLIMAKLPFAVPTDPIFAARSALFDDPFRDYALPQAVLRFKQGFGRLIRHKNDRGVLAVLDPRVRSRNYGAAFLRSIPQCTVQEGMLRQLLPAVKAWLSNGGKA